MRRILRLFIPEHRSAIASWKLSPQQHQQVLELLSEIGLGIIVEARGPVPLITFGRRMLNQLDTDRVGLIPLPHFADALKRIICDMQHDRLRVISPSDFPGVGYVYNAMDPETWPVQSSR